MAIELPLCLENPYREEYFIFPLLILEQSRGINNHTEEHVLQQFLSNITCIPTLFLLIAMNMFLAMSFKKPVIYLYLQHSLWKH